MWRLVAALGVAFILEACKKKNNEEQNGSASSAPSIPSPVTSASRSQGPLIPRGWTDRYNQGDSAVVPAPSNSARSIPTRTDCSRFTDVISGSRVVNAKAELAKLQNEVMPRLITHVREMQTGNFLPAQQDVELTRALSQLQGIGIYLQDGIPNVLDTESDWENLNTALTYLNFLANVQPDSNTHSEVSRARRSWAAGRMAIQFQGFMFRDDEVPHGLRNQTNVATPAPESLEFRIVTPTHSGNYQRFPVLETCNVNQRLYTMVDFNDNQ